jgi:hypothetical protein
LCGGDVGRFLRGEKGRKNERKEEGEGNRLSFGVGRACLFYFVILITARFRRKVVVGLVQCDCQTSKSYSLE